jgi:cyanophycin synthetase
MYYKILILIIIFLIIKYKFSNQENYKPIMNDGFINYLKANNYEIDEDNNIIKKDSKVINYDKSFNSIESVKISKNKMKTSLILKENKLPVPNFVGLSYSNFKNLKKDVKNLKFPLVAKPMMGSLGIDVETDIYDFKSLQVIVRYLSTKYNNIQIEEQVSGNSYRILIFNGNIIDIVERSKAYVIGNGHSNVIQLLNKLNETKKDAHKIKHVSRRYINKQGYNLDNVIPRDKKLYISNIINLHNGAILNKVDLNKVPEINKKLFIYAAKILNVKMTGLDFLSDNIYIPYYKNNGKILESNPTPDIGIHFNSLKKKDFYKKILDNLH